MAPDAPAWEPDLLRLEGRCSRGRAGGAGGAGGVHRQLPRRAAAVHAAVGGPEGGEPRAILRVRIAQAVLRALLANLPRLGLLRETYDLLRLARQMEQAQPTRGRGVTEFNHFFQSAYQAVVENIVLSALEWEPEHAADEHVVEILGHYTEPFLNLWFEHSQTLQLSVLEASAARPSGGPWPGSSSATAATSSTPAS